jgi:non-heme chloroperoxidase
MAVQHDIGGSDGPARARGARIGTWITGTVAALVVLTVVALAGLLAFGTAPRPAEMTSVSDPLRRVDFSDLPTLQQFKARDGAALSYRLYPGGGPDAVVLIHGSSGESSGMHVLAKALSAAGDTVYVPDLRGHGHDGPPGDIDYIGQLDDDLADFVGVIRALHEQGDLVLAGHSSGGGFVLRISERPDARWFSRFVLLSPLLPYGAATNRPDAGGWATPFIGRIVALRILNKVGIHWFNGLTIVAFAVAPHAAVPLDDSYSYRMQANFSAPHDALARLSSVKQPLAVLVGAQDEIMYADRYAPLIHRDSPEVPVTVVPGVDHMGMIVEPAAIAAVVAAIR